MRPTRTPAPPPATHTPDVGESTSVISLADITAAGAASVAHPGDDAPTGTEDREHAAGDGPTTTGPDDDLRPSGTPRVGRARRGGLLPARLTAKRPDEDVLPADVPLAAEPPGASVADVPGAGRRKAGLASLAAADRAAEESVPVPTGPDADDAEEPVSRFRRRQKEPRARGGADRPLRSSSTTRPR